jgi:hypothetical protein
VLLFRPNGDEIKIHGIDALRPEGLDRVALAAYDATASALDSDRFRDALGDVAA